MIIPDANLLLYAYDRASPFHCKAAAWWNDCLSGSESIGLPHATVFAFVRLGTHPRVFIEPLSAAEAASHVGSWLAQPCVQILHPEANHLDAVLKILESLGTAGNLVTDAQLAASALTTGAVLHTADTDFLRFQGLRWFNPITGARSQSVKRSREK
jgi:toxin-antitoxin system PIN domain toxin